MNIEQIRKDTKGCRDKIFLNSAGASLMPKPVMHKMIGYLEKEEELGGYETAELMKYEIEEFYTQTAELLNCNPENIAYTTNATDSFSRALSSIPFVENDSILTTDDDYISNQIAFIAYQKRFGVKVLRSKNRSNGDIDLEDFERKIKKHQPKLVAITHIPTNSGLVQQAEAVGELCRKHNSWYLLDACQSVGQLPVNVSKIGCDFLSATGRKFLRGPRGTGFLYVSDKVIENRLEPLSIDMRGANWTGVNAYEIQMNAKRFETWENSYASLIGLKEAVKYANRLDIDRIASYNKGIAQNLRKQLADIPKLSVLDKGSELSSIVTFHSEGVQLSQIEKILRENNIFHSVSQKTSALIDFSKKGVEWAIRLSPHYFNTAKEIEATAEIISNFRE